MPRKRTSVKRILNCEPSRNTEQDWLVEHARRSRAVAAGAPVPASKDLRAAWWRIGDQGMTGSCVGWALADSVLRWHFVKAGRLAQTQPLSPRYLWMASKETDPITDRPTTFIDAEGTTLKSALDVARKYGAVRDTVLPFGSGRLYAGETKTFYALAAQLKVSMYFNLGRRQSDWRLWLATKGPILTRLDVDATWDDARATHGLLDTYEPNTVRGGHAVAFVGYTPDRFIIRNSWGTAWGDGGFGYASVDYAAGAFTEAYGVVL